MSISYDVTSCAQLKCIVSCLNFGFEDIFIDGECLMIHMKHAVNTIYFAMFFFSVMNNLLQHIMLFVGGLIFLTDPPIYISTSIIKSYKNDKSVKHVYILLSICPSELNQLDLHVFRLWFWWKISSFNFVY